MKHKHEEQQCTVCGAAVRNKGWRRWNLLSATTCDPLCRRAQATGRTRPQQIKAEIQAEDRAARAADLADRLDSRMQVRAIEDSDYNRPYMHALV